jgi:hypothetical protein
MRLSLIQWVKKDGIVVFQSALTKTGGEQPFVGKFYKKNRRCLRRQATSGQEGLAEVVVKCF